MILSKKLQAFVDDAKTDDKYWVESAKLDFALMLEQQRRRAQLSYGNLANKIGASAAYVSKVFRGDSNLTIESMVKLARATGGQLDIRIVNSEVTQAEWKPVSRGHLQLVHSIMTTRVEDDAANEPVHEWKRAASV